MAANIFFPTTSLRDHPISFASLTDSSLQYCQKFMIFQEIVEYLKEKDAQALPS